MTSETSASWDLPVVRCCDARNSSPTHDLSYFFETLPARDNTTRNWLEGWLRRHHLTSWAHIWKFNWPILKAVYVLHVPKHIYLWGGHQCRTFDKVVNNVLNISSSKLHDLWTLLYSADAVSEVWNFQVYFNLQRVTSKSQKLTKKLTATKLRLFGKWALSSAASLHILTKQRRENNTRGDRRHYTFSVTAL